MNTITCIIHVPTHVVLQRMYKVLQHNNYVWKTTPVHVSILFQAAAITTDGNCLVSLMAGNCSHYPIPQHSNCHHYPSHPSASTHHCTTTLSIDHLSTIDQSTNVSWQGLQLPQPATCTTCEVTVSTNKEPTPAS